MIEAERATVEIDPPASIVGRSLRGSFVLHVFVRIVEALSVGWLACALVVATGFVTERDIARGELWIAAVLCGALAAASVWFEDPPRRAEHVRDVDRRLDLDGALVTTAGLIATEHSVAASIVREGTLAAALVRRVSARASGGDMARAALPRTPLALLAGLAGVAVLLAAQDARVSPESPFDARASQRDARAQAQSRAARALDQAADALHAAAQGASSAGANSAAALEPLAKDLAHAAHASGDRSSNLSELDRRIGAAAAAEPTAAVARALESARSAVDEARRADAVPTETASTGSTGARDSSAGAGRTDNTDGNASSGTTGSGVGLAQASANGRMSGPNADPRTHAISPAINASTGSHAVEHGIGATRWWPTAYDTVVENWLAGAPAASDH